MLNIEGADLVGGGKDLDLAVGGSAHKGGLACTVLAAKTVVVATLEMEGSRVEQDLGTVGERELVVAQILALLTTITLVSFGSRLDNPFARDVSAVRRDSNLI